MNRRRILIPLLITMIVLTVNFRSDTNLISSYKKMEAMDVSTYFKNNGIFNRNFETGGAGFEWGVTGSGNYLRYSSNIVLGAIVGQDTVISAEGSFQPGYIDINGDPQGRDDPVYRVYKIVNGDTTGQDYQEWPAGQGAYVRQNNKPYLIGEQTLFSTYTDGYTDNNSGANIPLKAQILETDWVFNSNGPLATAVFSEFRIINKSANVWNNFYAGIYTDDDIAEANDDKVAPDSSRNISYSYNGTNNSGTYGANPPAVSFNVLSGSDLFTGNDNDSIIYYRPVTSNNRVVKRGYKDLFLTSFNPFLNGNPVIGTPSNNREYYNVLQGLKKDGSVWINPNTNHPTRFPDIEFGAGDFKFLISSGPVTVNPGDTLTLIIVQHAARGSSNLASITSLKSGNTLLSNIYNSNFYTVSINEPGITTNTPGKYVLHQNYPNPFNPSTVIRYSIFKNSFVTLKVYDLLGNEIATLVNEEQNSGSFNYQFSAVNYQLSSGIYFYKLTAGNFSETRKMILTK